SKLAELVRHWGDIVQFRMFPGKIEPLALESGRAIAQALAQVVELIAHLNCIDQHLVGMAIHGGTVIATSARAGRVRESEGASVLIVKEKLPERFLAGDMIKAAP